MSAAASLGAIFLLSSFALAALAQTPPPEVMPSPDAGSALSIELVDPKVLRVCADPSNLPFSSQTETGFENKLAEFVARKLGKSLAYTWYPQAPGFVRNTLGSYRCDVIMGYPQGADLVQSTNPYYRTTYALVFKPGNGLDGIDRLADPRLKDKHIGVVAGTPPASVLAALGLMAAARPYHLVVDTRVESPSQEMIRDIGSGAIDAGLLWGPIAGYYAKRQSPPLAVVPLVNEQSGPRFVYRITMGVRSSDQEWKRTLNRLIGENQAEIDKILLDYGVPLLDEQNRAIATTGAGK
jgi:quinoprotein dehydrogenase-associated probable ABC transporter substrate-binding protein